MTRICFTLNVHPQHIDEYRARHRAVWPEMRQALADTGWHDYTLFLRPDGLLIGYLIAEDFQQAIAAMKALPINVRWQEHMAPLFAAQHHPDDNMTTLEEVFHLD
jgi:L-rhamnose mutarotase